MDWAADLFPIVFGCALAAFALLVRNFARCERIWPAGAALAVLAPLAIALMVEAG